VRKKKREERKESGGLTLKYWPKEPEAPIKRIKKASGPPKESRKGKVQTLKTGGNCSKKILNPAKLWGSLVPNNTPKHVCSTLKGEEA